MSIFPTKILLATDGSEEATLAARTAVDVAQNTDSELHVVHARPIPSLFGFSAAETLITSDIDEEELRKRFQGFLDEQVERIKAEGGSITQAHLRIGRPDTEIVALAKELGAGLIVVGSRGLGGLRRALLGNVSDSVVEHAHCPVLVVRQEEEPEEAQEAGPEEVGFV
jgi:nucleotide-binding universal stress UspA family protein